MRFFLGVDGGQTDTTALIGDETGRVLGKGSGGPCNHATAAEGRQKLVHAVSESVAVACAQAGLDTGAVCFAAACFGMSGGPEDKLAILREVVRADVVVVTDDAVVALAGATAGEPGIVTIAGTGSIAFGRNAAGQTARVGGWGYIFGDEGSGFDIARQALRAALRAEEGWGPFTALRRALIEATRSADANGVLHLFYTPDWPRSRVAGLAPLVDEAAMGGDAVARDILHNAAQQLAMLTSAVRQQLWTAAQPARVVWTGGVFRSRILLERYRCLMELENGNHAGPPEYDAATGALIEAYRAAGLTARLAAAGLKPRAG
ncbi:MAG TPA: BadF/BadG/BcrA/BcrD ATPase family protein [Bryobacteraceae bacterium]|jgi:N-acetylglucosamine kinase-like BadF-type ATPase|nr:BadF/BadG/BcrA/BcrD ATPase family protein [Bryobacteraceae bacterium]